MDLYEMSILVLLGCLSDKKKQRTFNTSCWTLVTRDGHFLLLMTIYRQKQTTIPPK